MPKIRNNRLTHPGARRIHARSKIRQANIEFKQAIIEYMQRPSNTRTRNVTYVRHLLAQLRIRCRSTSLLGWQSNILRHYNRSRLKIRPICSETMFAQASMSPRQIRSSAVVPNSRSLAYTSKTGNPTTPCRCTKGKGGDQIPGYS